MVIRNESVDTSASANTTNVVQQQSVSNLVQQQGTSSVAQQQGSDRVQLSKASSLVALAKGMMPADKQAKLDAVRAQVNSGQYNADSLGTSQGLIQGHTQR